MLPQWLNSLNRSCNETLTPSLKCHGWLGIVRDVYNFIKINPTWTNSWGIIQDGIGSAGFTQTYPGGYSLNNCSNRLSFQVSLTEWACNQNDFLQRGKVVSFWEWWYCAMTGFQGDSCKLQQENAFCSLLVVNIYLLILLSVTTILLSVFVDANHK